MTIDPIRAAWLALGAIGIGAFAYAAYGADQSRRHAEAVASQTRARIEQSLPKLRDKWEELKRRNESQ